MYFPKKSKRKRNFLLSKEIKEEKEIYLEETDTVPLLSHLTKNINK